MNEAETRAEHIDPALKAAGWGVVDGSRVLREHGITPGPPAGPGGSAAKAEIADYVLVYRNTKLAVIEAKAWDKPHTEGVGQAKKLRRQAGGALHLRTNGQAIYGIDMATAPRATWPLPQPGRAVEPDLCRRRPERLARPLRRRPFEDKGGTWQGRYYQDIADRARARRHRRRARPHPADAGHRHRQDLHRVPARLEAVSEPLEPGRLAWRNEPTRRPRILFLADRNILADQAYNAFSAFADDALVRIAPDDIRKKGGCRRTAASSSPSSRPS
jgi:type I restriction enzyme R subunit